MGISPQLRLGKGGTGMKAEPERSGKTEAEQWACSGTVQPVRTAQLLGNQARGPSSILWGSPGLVRGGPGPPWSSKPSPTLSDDAGH